MNIPKGSPRGVEEAYGDATDNEKDHPMQLVQ